MFGLVVVIGAQLMIGAARRRRMRIWILAMAAILGLFTLDGVANSALDTPSMAIFLSLLLGVGVGAASHSGAAAAISSRPRQSAIDRQGPLAYVLHD
jgi:hypothetical protein